jgi:hypothetical protein
MSNKNLFKEAIADAKAVREAALANAKAALEEALTPQLQNMLATKLQEMELDEEEAGYDPEMEEGFTTSHGDDSDENLDFNLEEDEDLDPYDYASEGLEEDFDLSEILAELEEDANLFEAKEEDEDEEDEEESIELDPEDPNFIQDLRDLINDIVDQKMGNEEDHAEPDEDNAGGPSDNDADNEDDEIDLEELLAELDAFNEGDDTEYESMQYEAKKMKAKKAKEEEEKKEMKEAIRTINTLRSELNEVNLLNAKLLYVNKIFKAKNLTESQKLKVIASFDKATTAKEAKVVFESLNNTLTAAPKQAIKESYGFASRAAGVAPKKAIVETNDAITRMQKLANIIK